jgi:hypothetical protein
MATGVPPGSCGPVAGSLLREPKRLHPMIVAGLARRHADSLVAGI